MTGVPSAAVEGNAVSDGPITVKFHVADCVVPYGLVAATDHWHDVPSASAATVSTKLVCEAGTVAESPELPHCTVTRYEAAPPAAFHVIVGRSETPVAPLAGDTSAGTAGAEPKITVGSSALTGGDPPPDTVTWLYTCHAVHGILATTVIAG